MAAPTPVPRSTPLGAILKDGFSTKITLTQAPAIVFWEKTVQPPGMDGGEPIEQTTMHNIAYRTMRSRALKTLTPHTTKAAWDPKLYNQLVPAINREDVITITFPNTSTLCFYGYLQKVEFDQMEEGKQPECTVTLVPTNYDPVNFVEEAPVFTLNAGT
jgi:hypothetical protein